MACSIVSAAATSSATSSSCCVWCCERGEERVFAGESEHESRQEGTQGTLAGEQGPPAGLLTSTSAGSTVASSSSISSVVACGWGRGAERGTAELHGAQPRPALAGRARHVHLSQPHTARLLERGARLGEALVAHVLLALVHRRERLLDRQSLWIEGRGACGGRAAVGRPPAHGGVQAAQRSCSACTGLPPANQPRLGRDALAQLLALAQLEHQRQHALSDRLPVQAAVHGQRVHHLRVWGGEWGRGQVEGGWR